MECSQSTMITNGQTLFPVKVDCRKHRWPSRKLSNPLEHPTKPLPPIVTATPATALTWLAVELYCQVHGVFAIVYPTTWTWGGCNFVRSVQKDQMKCAMERIAQASMLAVETLNIE